MRGRYGLYLVFQPKICLHTGKPVGLEALLRWKHPVEGEIPPGRFIPLAVGTSLMAELTDWVIDSTIRQLQRWAEKAFICRSRLTSASPISAVPASPIAGRSDCCAVA